MAWTDERVELLKKLWAEGLSARQIADQLGGVTRNAVIGKVHRLGLSGRATTSRAKTVRPRKKRTDTTSRQSSATATGTRGGATTASATARDHGAQPASRVKSFPKTPLTPIDELFIPLEDRVTIETLKEGQCKWPIGDPTEEDFHFCGHKRHGEGVYCEFHTAKAYQPARRSQPRKEQKQLISYR